jgi:hypothetical protein
MSIVQDGRLLRGSLAAGALYDLILGLFMLMAGPSTLSRLGQPLEGPALYWFYLSALPLFLLPFLYVTAAHSPHLDAFRTPVLAMRGLGGALVLASLWLGPRPAWLVALIGLVDLGWAGLYFLLWRQFLLGRRARIG